MNKTGITTSYTNGSNTGIYTISNLPCGSAIPLGNGLRRILLSSMEGAAVKSIRISGVMHEFSCIPGVKEDVTEIILNIKQLVIERYDNTFEDFLLTIDFTGPGILRAGNIQTPLGIEILNPELVICTVTGETSVSIELTAGTGRGNQLSDNTFYSAKDIIGNISIDAMYSPIISVNVDTREDGDAETLVMRVTTNGATSPDDAVGIAANILKQFLSGFASLADKPAEEVPSEETEESSQEDNRLIDVLELSQRASHCLLRGGINTVDELVHTPYETLSKIRSMGNKSLREVYDGLKNLGVEFEAREELEKLFK